MEEHLALKKKARGDLKGRWVCHDGRDTVIDLTSEWSEKAAVRVSRFR